MRRNYNICRGYVSNLKCLGQTAYDNARDSSKRFPKNGSVLTGTGDVRRVTTQGLTKEPNLTKRTDILAPLHPFILYVYFDNIN